MAIWDKQEKPLEQASADTYKCPGCGTNLLFESKSGKLKCNYCDSEYYPEFFEISDVLNNLDDAIDDIDEEDYSTKQEIVCNACGSSIIADKTTSATFCPFCGSPALVKNKLSRKYKPDYIIPFKISREKAIDILKEWASSKRYLPKDFSSSGSIEKINGLYVPFWLIDADCNINFVGGGSKIDTGAHYEYRVSRKGSFKIHRVPFDGSKEINDNLMECIEPFDYSDLVPYSNGYLPGYFAECYDLSVDDMAERISIRFRKYMSEEQATYMSMDDYLEYSIDKDMSNSSNYNCSYALLPVWFLTYKYKNILYRVAINGQTGKISGRAPFDSTQYKLAKVKATLQAYSYAIIYSTLLIALIALLVYAFVVDGIKFFSFTIFLSIMAVLLLSATILIGYYRREIGDFIKRIIPKVNFDESVLNDVDDLPVPGYTYMDSRDAVSIIREDKLLGIFIADEKVNERLPI